MNNNTIRVLHKFKTLLGIIWTHCNFIYEFQKKSRDQRYETKRDVLRQVIKNRGKRKKRKKPDLELKRVVLGEKGSLHVSLPGSLE